MDETDIACTSGDFAGIFKLTLSSNDTIKVHWKSFYGYEPSHLGVDDVTDSQINSCIELVDNDNHVKVACLQLKRATGAFRYIYGDPRYNESEYPTISSWNPGEKAVFGHCTAGQRKAF